MITLRPARVEKSGRKRWGINSVRIETTMSFNYYAESYYIDLLPHVRHPQHDREPVASRRLDLSLEFSKMVAYQWSRQDSKHVEADAIQAMRRAGLQ